MKRSSDIRYQFQRDEPRFRVLVWRDSEGMAYEQANPGPHRKSDWFPTPDEIREFTTQDGAQAFAYLTEHPARLDTSARTVEGEMVPGWHKGPDGRWTGGRPLHPACVIQVGILHWQTPDETETWLKDHFYIPHPDPFDRYGDGPKLTKAKQDVEFRPYLNRQRDDGTPLPKPELGD